ncbi:putative transmembrane protein [Cinnamomum micranthum f. kanehirae]|uniref:Putative transmembrane protein n=1 Tax=Cinnamomum micranthum f. kanehirae TaxID=337451 RepID=A0A3S5WGL5_9MAGN|nr:putative transmembrane protein [Cinnamomum micranthum f. kanehirae]
MGREKKEKRVVVVRVNQGFGFNEGGGGKDNSNTARLLGNIAFAIGLTYLSMTGQLGWILDTIVSIWCPEPSLSLLDPASKNEDRCFQSGTALVARFNHSQSAIRPNMERTMQNL